MSGCYGLEKCLSSFDLVDIQPGSKLHGLGLRKVDLSMSAVTQQRDELEQLRVVLAGQMKQRQLELVRQEELRISAVYCSIGSTTGCTITEKAPTRTFSWLKAPTSAFTFKTLLRHYAKWALTPRSLNVKLGPQRNYHKGWAGWLA